MDRGLGCADEVREGLALAACRECRVEQRRGVGAAADVGVADGRRLAVRAGERDLPGAERPIGVRDRRLRLLAGEPAEFRAADADAGQDPALVLLAPCVQGAGADADGEQEAHDEREAEAEGERPSAPRPCRELVGGHGGDGEQDGVGVDTGLGSRRTSAASSGSPRTSTRLRRRRCVGPDERRELGVAGGRLAVGCGDIGSPVGCGVGQSWSSGAHVRWAGAGLRPWQPRHLRVCTRICHATVASAGGTGTRDAPQTLRGRTWARTEIARGGGSIRDHAKLLVDAETWPFWWD